MVIILATEVNLPAMPSHMVTFLHCFLKYNIFANAYKLAAVLYNNLYTSESHSLLASVSHAELHHIAGMIIFRYKVITKLHTTVLFEADALVKYIYIYTHEFSYKVIYSSEKMF